MYGTTRSGLLLVSCSDQRLFCWIGLVVTVLLGGVGYYTDNEIRCCGVARGRWLQAGENLQRTTTARETLAPDEVMRVSQVCFNFVPVGERADDVLRACGGCSYIGSKTLCVVGISSHWGKLPIRNAAACIAWLALLATSRWTIGGLDRASVVVWARLVRQWPYE